MFAAFSTALSALDANGVAVDVVGNNLANMNTTGYKESVAYFQRPGQRIDERRPDATGLRGGVAADHPANSPKAPSSRAADLSTRPSRGTVFLW